MSLAALVFVSIVAGGAISIQSGMSGQVAKILGSPFFASFALFVVSALMMAGVVGYMGLPQREALRQVPPHLWFLGSLFSVIALTAIYWVMPQIGVGKLMAGAVAGQAIVSMVATHYGWFELPQQSIDFSKIVGVLLLMVGVVLITKN